MKAELNYLIIFRIQLSDTVYLLKNMKCLLNLIVHQNAIIPHIFCMKRNALCVVAVY